MIADSELRHRLWPEIITIFMLVSLVINMVKSKSRVLFLRKETQCTSFGQYGDLDSSAGEHEMYGASHRTQQADRASQNIRQTQWSTIIGVAEQ